MNSQPEGDAGRNKCGICYQQMANYGPMQVVCLKCGHVFCSRCIAMSLKVKKQCPVCYAPAKSADVRLLYCNNMVIRDEAAIADLRLKLQKEECLRRKTEERLRQAEAKIQSLLSAFQKGVSVKEEAESVLPKLPEEISLLDDDESDVASPPDEEIHAHGELQFHFTSHIACGNASFLTPDNADSFGNPLACSSLYFAQSLNREQSALSRLSSVDTERGTVVSLLAFPQLPITGIKKIPQTSQLLLCCASQQHIYDPRLNAIVWSSQFASPIEATCPSASPFQLCVLVVALIASFAATSDALFEVDYRGPSPVSILASSEGALRSLFSPLPHTLFYTMHRARLQCGHVTSLAAVADTWTRTGQWKAALDASETWGVAAGGMTEIGDVWLGIAHTAGVDVVCGRQRQMLWDYEMKARIDYRREETPLVRPAFFQSGAGKCICVCGDHAVSLFSVDAQPRELGRLEGSSWGRLNDEILLSSRDVQAHVLATSNGIVVHQLL